jgi:hypothetical protein
MYNHKLCRAVLAVHVRTVLGFYRRRARRRGVPDGRGGAVGVDNIMWSTDCPHHGCDWPHSRRVVGEMMNDLPAAERRKIIYENAARLYGVQVGG